ncbi:MAG: universal stress protein [Microcystaceae cyanobacterium]
MFQRCLICTDFSDGLFRLVNFIPQLASSGLKKIVFCHSISVWEEGKVARVDEEKIAEAQELLSPALQSIPEGVEVKIECPSGQPIDSILKLIQTEDIDVVIGGSPIRSALESRMFGSTAINLGKSTNKPLMVMRPQLISTYRDEELALRCQHLWRYILIPYNDGEAAKYLLERIKEYAKNQTDNGWSQCLLLWVVDENTRQPDISQNRLEEAQDKLQEIKQDLEQYNLSVVTEVRVGSPVLEIFDAALNYDISAIAIATDYRKNILSWTVPSVVNELLQRSWFPLLFFSPKQ